MIGLFVNVAGRKKTLMRNDYEVLYDAAEQAFYAALALGLSARDALEYYDDAFRDKYNQRKIEQERTGWDPSESMH